MNKSILFAFVAVLVAVVTARPDDKYTTKYDNVDLQEILKNQRLLKGYVFCLLDKGPCSPDGTELKKVLPDAISNHCAKCSDKQQNGSRTVLKHLIENEPAYWKDLEAKYDPSGQYKAQYKAEAEKEGIKL